MKQTYAENAAGAEATESLTQAPMLFAPVEFAEPAASPADANSRRCESKERTLAREIRPGERLLQAGPEALSGAELLAVLFRAGRCEKESLDLAADVISERGGLYEISRSGYHELLEIHGMDRTRATVVLAAVELGKRLASASIPERPTIGSPADVHALLGSRLASYDREHFIVVLLNTKNRVLASPTVSIGTLSSSLVHPREVFKPAVKASAASVILAHNHPSGHLEPSREDRDVTERLIGAGQTLGIEVLDHVIVGDGYLSLKEHGML